MSDLKSIIESIDIDSITDRDQAEDTQERMWKLMSPYVFEKDNPPDIQTDLEKAIVIFNAISKKFAWKKEKKDHENQPAKTSDHEQALQVADWSRKYAGIEMMPRNEKSITRPIPFCRFRLFPYSRTVSGGGKVVTDWLFWTFDGYYDTFRKVHEYGIGRDWSRSGPLYYQSWRYSWIGRLILRTPKRKAHNKYPFVPNLHYTEEQLREGWNEAQKRYVQTWNQFQALKKQPFIKPDPTELEKKLSHAKSELSELQAIVSRLLGSRSQTTDSILEGIEFLIGPDTFISDPKWAAKVISERYMAIQNHKEPTEQ